MENLRPAVAELVKAIGAGDAETIESILFDSIIDLEAYWLTATTCDSPFVGCDEFARLVQPDPCGLVLDRERLVKKLSNGQTDQVVAELGGLERRDAICLIALICDWRPTAAAVLARKMDYLADHPEKLGA